VLFPYHRCAKLAVFRRFFAVHRSLRLFVFFAAPYLFRKGMSERPHRRNRSCGAKILSIDGLGQAAVTLNNGDVSCPSFKWATIKPKKGGHRTRTRGAVFKHESFIANQQIAARIGRRGEPHTNPRLPNRDSGGEGREHGQVKNV